MTTKDLLGFERKKKVKMISRIAKRASDRYLNKIASNGVDFIFDYDWDDPSTTFTSANLTLPSSGSDEEVRQVLINAGQQIHNDSMSDDGNAMFVPKSVNGDPADLDSYKEYTWVVRAVLSYLDKNPDARQFAIDGDIN